MAEFEHNSEKFGYINLDDLEGVQTALGKLEYDPGTIDGLDGPKTQNAVRKFQPHASIKVIASGASCTSCCVPRTSRTRFALPAAP